MSTGLILLGAGCGSGHLTAPDSLAATSPAAAPSSVAGGAASSAALDASALRLRAQVDRVTHALGSRVTRQSVLVDDPAPCALVAGAGSWPRRWGYSVLLQVAGANGAPAARAAAKQLRTEGWTVREPARGTDVAEANASHQGVQIHLLGGERLNELTVEGYGTCLLADGTAAPA